MKINVISDNNIKVVLTKSESIEFKTDLTALCNKMMHMIKQQTQLDFTGRKLEFRIYPYVDGGCLLNITAMDCPQCEHLLIYRFKSLCDIISLCRLINPDKYSNSQLIDDNNGFYLSIEVSSDHLATTEALLDEYGEFYSCCDIDLLILIEHYLVVIERDAIQNVQYFLC